MNVVLLGSDNQKEEVKRLLRIAQRKARELKSPREYGDKSFSLNAF